MLGSFAWHGSSTLLAKESYKVVLNNGTVWGNKVWKKLENKVANNVTISSKGPFGLNLFVAETEN